MWSLEIIKQDVVTKGPSIRITIFHFVFLEERKDPPIPRGNQGRYAAATSYLQRLHGDVATDKAVYGRVWTAAASHQTYPKH